MAGRRKWFGSRYRLSARCARSLVSGTEWTGTRGTKAQAGRSKRMGRGYFILRGRPYRWNDSFLRLLHVFRTKEDETMATETRETGSLIGSDKVEGTAVYGADDTKIGSIERVMIDKMSGKVSYAVLSFGGFLGVGDDHYPLPWQSLKYDTNLGGYRTGITETQLKGAPKYGNDNAWNWSDPARTRSVNDYYGIAI
jgi:hypothetical protein